ncbi:zinc finger protein Xfin-like [Contarinia nasturtii]|uniref:zinc finger protein Xfin-like n=1 Tax=Contarinia nasturtii TaxID=265458 RepID=UPI0012D430DA|nr:zinc finger protein Xfin-like [Contarinia nasturtii]
MSDNGNDTKCLKCNLNFTSSKTLKKHEQEKHSQSVVKCFKCNLKFSNQERFRAHWNSKHVTATKKVTKPSTSTNEEIVALDVEHDSSEAKSPKSPRSPKSPKTRKNASPTSNRCTKCYKTFSTRMFAALHYRRVHMDWTTKCEVCHKMVKKNVYLAVHLKKHRINGEISADRMLEIQKENKKKQSSNTEFKVKVKPKVATACPDCGKVFISNRVMKIHWMKNHYVQSNKTDADRQSASTSSTNAEETTKACPKCNKEFKSDGRMKIHYFQAHVKQATPSIRKKKKMETIPEITSYPRIKSVSELRSKPPAITFNSNKCPVCRKVFSSNVCAKIHFQNVHRKETVKCPHPQCFTRCSNIYKLRAHFSNAHPQANLPTELQVRRKFNKSQLDSTDGEQESASEQDIIDQTPKKKFKEDKKESTNDSSKSNNNPLLKMFERMREKNAKSPVIPAKIVSEVIDIEEGENDEDNGCFTLDFDKCSKCIKKFPTREAALMHYNQNHPQEMQICPECDMLVTSTRVMSYHFKSKHPTTVMPLYLKTSRAVGYSKELFDQFNMNMCTICKLEFTKKVDSLNHFNDEHGIKFEICSVCTRGFRTEAMLLSHWARSHEHLKFVEFKAQKSMQVEDEAQTEADSNSTPSSRSSTPTSTSKIIAPIISKTGSKYGNTKVYPFIKSVTCPICDRNYSTRKSTVMHYRSVHCRNGISCEVCSTILANREDLKEHWLEVHKDVPWKDTEDSMQNVDEAEKDQNDDNDDSIDMVVDSSREEQTTSGISPILNAVVSLVDIVDNPNSLEPEMRSQFLKIVQEMENTSIEDTVSESEQGTVATDIDEEPSLPTSQNEPLDLSTNQHKMLDPNLIKSEIIEIKYKSSADLVSSFVGGNSVKLEKENRLSDGTNVIVKDEITVEELKLEES